MALVLDAATKYLSRTSDLLDYNAAYTWMARVRFGSLTTFDSVFVISDGTANNRDILLLNTAAPAERIGIRVTVGGAQTTQIGSTVLSTGVWYDLVVVRSSATSLQLYINGTLEVTNTRDVSSRGGGSAMRVGLDQSGSNAATIDITYMKAWSTNLSTAQITNERRQIKMRYFGSVYGWWPMLKGSQRNVDFSGKGRNWTENGTISDTAGPGLTWGADVSTVILPPDERFGTLTAAAPSVTVSATGTVEIDGTASIAAPAVTVSATGTVDIDGTASIAAPPVTVSATGEVEITGTLTAAAPSVTVSGSGVVGDDITGELHVVISVTVSGTGTVDIDGTASAGAPAITVSSTGTVEITGTLTAAAPVVTISATGAVDVVATGSIAAPTITISATAINGEVVLIPTWEPERTYVVERDERTYVVPVDDRTFSVPQDARSYRVEVE